MQVVRALAALAVLQSHLWTSTGGSSLGAAGVDVFFVLSGYIVSESARRKPEVFLRSRLLRVLPPYAFAGFLALMAAAGAGLEWREVLASLTLWPAYDRLAWPYLPVAWSLCYEMLFYAALWLVTRGVRPGLLLLAFAACWALAFVSGAAPLRFIGSPIVLEFIAGTLLARVPAWRWSGLAALAVGVFGFWAGSLAVDPGWLGEQEIADPAAILRVALWGPPAVLLIYGAIHSERLFRGVWARPLVFLGDASYSLYLFHLLIGTIAVTMIKPASHWVTGAICVGVSVIIYLGFERPLGRILRERFIRSAPSPQPIFQLVPSE